MRFFVFYAVILLAFSTAFRALFLLSDEITPDHPDIWSVMFGTFNIMFDSGSHQCLSIFRFIALSIEFIVEERAQASFW